MGFDESLQEHSGRPLSESELDVDVRHLPDGSSVLRVERVGRVREVGQDVTAPVIEKFSSNPMVVDWSSDC